MERAEEKAGDWHQTRWCKSQRLPVTRKNPRGDDERREAGPGQGGAARGRDGAAWRHEGPGVTCKANSDSRAGINSPEEQKASCTAE